MEMNYKLFKGLSLNYYKTPVVEVAKVNSAILNSNFIIFYFVVITLIEVPKNQRRFT